MDEDQNLERRNVERAIFRNLRIANIKITKDELFKNFAFELNFLFFRNWTPKIFNNFSNCEILIFEMVEFFFIFQIVQFYKTVIYSKLVNYYKLIFREIG